MINKIITSEGNVQFIYGDSGKIINVHPFHVYTVFNVDTVSFLLIAMPKDSGLAIFTTKAEDLEINGETYTFEELPNALSEAFAIAGAQARAEIVDELPETGMTNTIYLVPKEDGHGYDEYIYIKETGTWELIGDTDIELSRYVKKTDFNAYTAQTAAKIDYLSGATDAEVAAREAADSFISGAVDTLSTALANEVQRAKDVESGLSDAIDAEETRALAAEDALDDKIDAVSGDVETETARAEGVENAISGALDTHIADEVRHITAAERTDWDEKTKTISLTQAEYNALPSTAKTDATKLYVISDALPIDLSVYAKVSALTEEISARSAADTALDNKIGVVSGNVEAETARAEGVENVLSGAIDTIDAKFIDDAKYEDSGNTKVINFYNGNTIKATIDCSDFIVDGMVDDVRIENGYLVIDFNTASGKQDIQIPLTDIFNPSNYYTKSETSGATEIANALAQKLSISDFNTYSGTIETALNGKADTATTYTKTEVDNAITAATSTKQDTLVSSENIKTINNESILGSGNITIQGGGGEVSSAITSGDTNAVAGGAVFDAVVYSANTYNTELTFDANGYAENWIVGQSAITIDVSGYTSDTRANYHFENSNGEDLGRAYIFKTIASWGGWWGNNADNCTITTDGDTATTATITDIPSGTVKIRRTGESNPPKAIISGDTPEIWIKDALDDHRDNTTVHITAAERTSWNNKSNFSGSYNDLTDKPIPDSALNKYSDNPLKNSALFDELRIASGDTGTTDLTITFDGGNSTNYPTDCRQIKVELVNSVNGRLIFRDSEGHDVGDYYFETWGTPRITNNLVGSTYELSGSTVIISYPNVSDIARLNNEYGTQVISSVAAVMPNYTYVPVVDQVVANTTALGGLKLQQISQSDYDNLPTKDNNTLYVII